MGEEGEEGMSGLKVGDTITCHNKYDMIDVMHELEVEGIETDFDYSGDKPRLIVTAIKEDKDE